MKSSVFFIGHGSPEHIVEENCYTKMWKRMKQKVAMPSAIVLISAHWVSDEVRIQGNDQPGMFHDMYGFPEKYYQGVNQTTTDKQLVDRLVHLIPNSVIDYEHGYDVGVHAILSKMYPEQNIPVVQISIDRNKSFQEHFKMGQLLKELREDNIMVIGSGNIVHNMQMFEDDSPQYRYLLDEFDMNVVEAVLQRDDEQVLHPEKYKGYEMAVPTVEHYIPLLYAYGASDESDTAYGFNENFENNASTMSSILFEAK